MRVPMIGAVCAVFLAGTGSVQAQETDDVKAFRTSISMPYTILSAERVRGIRDVVMTDPFLDTPDSVLRLDARAASIQAEHGIVVSAQLREAAREGGRQDALAYAMTIEDLDEQARIGILLPTYLEAEHDTLASWSQMMGMTEVEAARFSILTISAGMRGLVLDDQSGSVGLVLRAQDVLSDSKAGRDASALLGYQAQVLTSMGAMTSLAHLEDAMHGISASLDVIPMTSIEMAEDEPRL